MNKTKLILTLALTFVVLFAQAGNVAAAPQAQTAASITGTITDITLETDANGVTTVLVTLDNLGVTQTVRISVDTAAALGLLILDPATNQPVLDPVTNLPLVDETQKGQLVEIPSDAVTPAEEVTVHPISALLASFFGEEASVIDGYHTDGFGFGLIAQALWMSQNLTATETETGDASLAREILDARQNKDFESFFAAHPEYLQDDASIPTNWGQFRKALSNKKENLGVVVSGKADKGDTSVQQQDTNGNGNGNSQGNGQGNGKDKHKNKGKDK